MAFETCQFKLIELKAPLFKDLPYNYDIIIPVSVYDYVSSPFIKRSLYNWKMLWIYISKYYYTRRSRISI